MVDNGPYHCLHKCHGFGTLSFVQPTHGRPYYQHRRHRQHGKLLSVRLMPGTNDFSKPPAVEDHSEQPTQPQASPQTSSRPSPTWPMPPQMTTQPSLPSLQPTNNSLHHWRRSHSNSTLHLQNLQNLVNWWQLQRNSSSSVRVDISGCMGIWSTKPTPVPCAQTGRLGTTN